MKQGQEIFKRYEKKYLLDEKSFRIISRRLDICSPSYMTKGTGRRRAPGSFVIRFGRIN